MGFARRGRQVIEDRKTLVAEVATRGFRGIGGSARYYKGRKWLVVACIDGTEFRVPYELVWERGPNRPNLVSVWLLENPK